MINILMTFLFKNFRNEHCKLTGRILILKITILYLIHNVYYITYKGNWYLIDKLITNNSISISL